MDMKSMHVKKAFPVTLGHTSFRMEIAWKDMRAEEIKGEAPVIKQQNSEEVVENFFLPSPHVAIIDGQQKIVIPYDRENDEHEAYFFDDSPLVPGIYLKFDYQWLIAFDNEGNIKIKSLGHEQFVNRLLSEIFSHADRESNIL